MNRNNSPGIRALKTPIGQSVRTIPNYQRSRFLDIFMLQTEKTKLERECEVYSLGLAKATIRIKEIEKGIRELFNEEVGLITGEDQDSVLRPKPISERPTVDRWDKMQLEY